ncbi:MAG: 6-phosphofructokinase, partial [Deltaproteobacteria bacterium]|nr:6-phosphofructokinase [Deltaproteobacteria bacterium]
MEYNSIETDVQSLGNGKIVSPIQTPSKESCHQDFISDTSRVLIDIEMDSLTAMIKKKETPASFELAGPRSRIYFDPSKLKCALVTCGGLCPGLNGILRSVVLELFYGYGVRNVYGIRYGLQGFIPKYGHDVIELKPKTVTNIIRKGGSLLTLVAATKIVDAIVERGLKISVVGIPKTIDNDIYMVSRSFGFDSAVDVATMAIRAAHNEAEGYPNGIGLLKLMGRHSGFIAATATLAQQDVNFVLIPEVDFDLEGPNGLLRMVEKRLELRKHAVIVVAEGAGQKYFENKKTNVDKSGNIRLKDIGLFLKDAISSYFKAKNIEIALKYIDPSYVIRSLPANSNDHVFCNFLGRDAVHAAMAGKTNVLIGHW